MPAILSRLLWESRDLDLGSYFVTVKFYITLLIFIRVDRWRGFPSGETATEEGIT